MNETNFVSPNNAESGHPINLNYVVDIDYYYDYLSGSFDLIFTMHDNRELRWKYTSKSVGFEELTRVLSHAK